MCVIAGRCCVFFPTADNTIIIDFKVAALARQTAVRPFIHNYYFNIFTFAPIRSTARTAFGLVRTAGINAMASMKNISIRIMQRLKCAKKF